MSQTNDRGPIPSPRTGFRRFISAGKRFALVWPLVCGGALAAGADQTAVSVTFGKDAKETGITTKVWSKPGGESVATHGGKTGLQTDLTKGAWGIWGDVSDAFIHDGVNHVKVSIEYWDQPAPADAEHAFKFYYDSAQRPLARAPMTFFTGSNTWKTASFVLENAKFAGREEGGADFKLFCTDADMCIRSITIEKIPEAVPTTALKVVPATAGLIEGEVKNLSVIYTPMYATDKFATWTSDNPAVATVNRLGQVTAVSAGKATITATNAESGPKATCAITVTAVPGTGVIAARNGAFLDTIGINSAISSRGENLAKTLECVKYVGFRWIRAGLGCTQDCIELNKATGVKFSLGFSGDINRFVRGAREFAAHKMLLAYEGPNEPNNWGLTYQDVKGGGGDSWVPVLKLQRDFYAAVKSDPVLCNYPVWHLTEGGAEVDNVGAQLLFVPKGANIAMPDGTQFADYACVHNYCSHPSWQGLHDDQTWLSSDPTPDCPVDGLWKEFGVTWAKKYQGYSGADLQSLPRVTTETGMTIDGTWTEEIQARLYLGVYLSQFKQGWSWTSIYILRDRVDEGGNQTFGFYRPDYTPRKSAVYLHNLTTILADTGSIAVPGRLNYTIPNRPAAVHDLLLQKSDGKFCLVVWGERYVSKPESVTINLGGKIKTVTLFDPTVGTDAMQTLNDVDAVTVTLGTNPVVIEL